MDETLNLVININVNEKVENRWIVPLIYGFFVFFIFFHGELSQYIQFKAQTWRGYFRLEV